MKRIIIYAIIVLLLIQFSIGEKMLNVIIKEENSTLQGADISVFEPNNYYSDKSYLGAVFGDPEYIISAYNNNTNESISQEAYAWTNYNFNYSDSITKIEISKNQSIVYEKNLTFCNFNNVCEPCLSGNCTNYENELTCSDCNSSSSDGYCSIKNDRLCDPDCVPRSAYEENITSGCFEDIFLNNEFNTENLSSLELCQNLNGSICNSDYYCKRSDILILENNFTCCVSGTCRETIVEENYTNLNLDITNTKPFNYSWIFVAIGVLIIIGLIYFFRKKKIFTISLFFVLVLSSSLYFFNIDRARITGYATSQQPLGNMISWTTTYNTPVETDYSSWNEFYQKVRLEGSGIAIFNGVSKICSYDTIKKSKEDSASSCINDPSHSRGFTSSGTTPTAKRTVACPNPDGSGLKLGTQVFIDFGTNYPWTGCYVCEDRGGWIKIADGSSPSHPKGQYHFDVYIGVGKDAENKNQLPESANVYLGCNNAPQTPTNPTTPNEPATPNTNTQTPGTTQIMPANIPDDITSGDKLGFYYLNPSFSLQLGYDMDVYSKLIQSATELISNCKAGSTTQCILPSCWTKKCTDNNGKQICKINVTTFYNSYYLNEQKRYIAEPNMSIKFALELDKMPKDSSQKCEPPKPPEKKPVIPPPVVVPPPVVNPPIVNPPINVGYKPCGTSGKRSLGVDVYSGDGGEGTPINFPKLKSSGFDFAFIKSSEGNSIDSDFSGNVDRAVSASVVVGAYHFARPEYNTGVIGAQKEAVYFYNTIKPKLGKMKLAPALDFEPKNQEGIAKEWVDAFMAKFYEVSKNNGKAIMPILYTNINYIGFIDPQGSKYRLWIANWPDSLSNWPQNLKAVLSTGENPRISRNWDFWQFYVEGKGTDIGIPGNRATVDVDVFNGDMSCLTTRYSNA